MLCMKRLVSGPTTAVFASFNNLGHKPSGPVALLFFNNVIFLTISRLDKIILDIHGTGMEHGLVRSCGAWSCPEFNFSAIVEKKQFIRLAFSMSFTAKLLSSRVNGPIFFLTLGWYIPIRRGGLRLLQLISEVCSLRFPRSDVISFLNLL